LHSSQVSFKDIIYPINILVNFFEGVFEMKRFTKLFFFLIAIIFVINFKTKINAQELKLTGNQNYNQYLKKINNNYFAITPRYEEYFEFGTLSIMNIPNITYNKKLTQEEVLSIVLNANGKQSQALTRAKKLEDQRVQNSKLVQPYNYMYLGYIQLAYDMKLLTKKQYLEAMEQVKPSFSEHLKMTAELISKNDQIVSKAIYEGRPYSNDDLIFIRSGLSTRQEAAYYFANAFKIKMDSSIDVASTYMDFNQIDAKFLSSVNTLLKMNVLVGKEDGLIHPNDPITIEEILLVLNRLEDEIFISNGYKKVMATLQKINSYTDKNEFLFKDENGNTIKLDIVKGKNDILLLKNRQITNSSNMVVGNKYKIIYNNDGIALIAIDEDKAKIETIVGVVDSIDTKKSQITVLDENEKSYKFTYNNETTFMDKESGKSINISDLSIGSIIEVAANGDYLNKITVIPISAFEKMQRFTGKLSKLNSDNVIIANSNTNTYKLSRNVQYIKLSNFTEELSKNDFYEGQNVLIGAFGGYVHFISTTFNEVEGNIINGIFSEIDTNLNYIEIWDKNGILKTFRLSKNKGYKIVMGENKISANDIEMGDSVSLYFDEGYVKTISKSPIDNQLSLIGEIISVQRDIKTNIPEKLVVKANNKVLPPFAIQNAKILSLGDEVSKDKITEGQMIKINGNIFGNFIYPKSIEISTENKVKNVYYANITITGQKLFMSDIGIIRNNDIEKIYNTKTVDILPNAIFINNDSLQEIKDVKNAKALVVTQDVFGQEMAKLINISSKYFSLNNGKITSIKGSTITLNGKTYYQRDTTYMIKEGYLVKINPSSDDQVKVLSFGENLALVEFKSITTPPMILRAYIDEIKELEWIKLKNYSILDKQNGWQFVNTENTLYYGTQTLYYDKDGLNDNSLITSLKGKYVYIITYGKTINSILSADFGAYIISAKNARNSNLENVKYFDPLTEVWDAYPISSVKLDDSQAVYIDYNGNITSNRPLYGDNITLLIAKSNWDKTNSKLKPQIIILE